MSMLPQLRTRAPHLRTPRPPRRPLAAVAVAVPASPHLVDCAIYVDGRRRPGPCTPADIAAMRRAGDGFVWLGLHDPDEAELTELAERFDLHPLAVEDALSAEHQRPKLDRYEDTLFVVLKTVRYVHPSSPNGEVEVVESGEISVFVGRDFVITVRRGEPGGLRGLRRTLELDPERLALGPSAVLHAIMDRIVDDYLAVVESMQLDIDAVETAVFGGPGRSRRDAERIYVLKREVLELRRAATPLAAPLRTLSERPVRLVNPEIREYFRDVEDHLARVTEQIGAFDELLTTIIQANLAQVTVEQNEDMRRISAWVAILAIPTAVAGIYGMNFTHMPELAWRYGYPLTLAVILVVCLTLYRGFRRNGWL
ncbi:MAG TPA: magnesium and cobalt transport protein CorA [Mycobacteriales bacterium]|jgi:magnesium transporter|nr:magnesium and cobalt transport protein CorA [Mycobacteriales bacterium]